MPAEPDHNGAEEEGGEVGKAGRGSCAEGQAVDAEDAPIGAIEMKEVTSDDI